MFSGVKLKDCFRVTKSGCFPVKFMGSTLGDSSLYVKYEPIFIFFCRHVRKSPTEMPKYHDGYKTTIFFYNKMAIKDEPNDTMDQRRRV